MLVKIEKLDHTGKGITRINDKVTFIEKALPGEIVDIRISKEKKNYNEGVITSIIEESKERIIPECPYYNECGGCEIMHMTYTKQLDFKKDKVKNILKKYSNIDIEPEIFASNKSFNYRNKITLHKKDNKLGYMKKHSNEIIEINNCPLAMESINNYIELNKNKVKDELVIRSNELGQVISNIDDKSLIININEFKFKVDIKSFFQVNNYICAKIFEFIENNMNKCNTCLDLYSGVGTLSLVASKKANFVYGIEINENSHKNSLENLKLNNIKNVEFILGDVEKEINKFKEKIDVIITDPPRSGIDTNTIIVINKLKPKQLIYMSCNPMTLARDLKMLNDYQLEKITLFDMFPNTLHVECVCVLNRS